MTAEAQVIGDLGRKGGESLWRHPLFIWSLLLSAAVVASSVLWWESAQSVLFAAEFSLAELVPRSVIAEASFAMLPLIAFSAGLLASFSPCVLPLVPLNVAYVGAHEASGWRALRLSTGFVVGAVLTLSLLGLVGDLAGFLLVDHRGYLLLFVGAVLVYSGCAALDVVPPVVPGFRFASRSRSGPVRAVGPVGAGAAFALATAPCASPLLVGVLAAASAQSMPGLALISMFAFSVGYTLLVFAGGALGGGLVARAKQISVRGPRAAAAGLLLVAGLTFGAAGVSWF